MNDSEIRTLAKLQASKGKSVVLIPSFKSYLDFVILHYIHIMYELDLPFVSGLQVFSDVAVMTKVLKKCGGFFVD